MSWSLVSLLLITAIVAVGPRLRATSHPAVGIEGTLAAPRSVASVSAGDWPTYLHDPARTADNPNENTLGTSNVGRLAQLWRYSTGAPVAAAPTVVGGRVYVGSWNGYEYAFNASSGHKI